MKRPQWPELPAMIAMTLDPPGSKLIFGLRPIAGAAVRQDDGSDFEIVYLDTPSNASWRNGGDAREVWRREPAVLAMRKDLRRWRGWVPGESGR